MRTILRAASAAALLFGAQAAADWQEDYRAFQEAAAGGDQAQMLTAAETVWRSSAAELPPSENRALLAQNFATLALFTEPELAAEAYADVTELGEAGFGTANMKPATAEFLHAFARSHAQPKSKRLANKAGQAAEAVPVSDHPINSVILAMQTLAQRHMQMQQFQRVPLYLAPVANSLSLLGGMDTRTILGVEALRIVSVVSNPPGLDHAASRVTVQTGKQQFTDQLGQSVGNLRRLINRFDTQESIETFDPTLAELMAWERLVSSYHRSWEGDTATDMLLADLPSLKPGIARPAGCGSYDWERNSLTFPRQDASYNGAVFIGFHFDEEGNVYGQRVLAEVPTRAFGDHALGQMRTWKADVSGLNLQCSKDHLFSIEFYTRPPQ